MKNTVKTFLLSALVATVAACTSGAAEFNEGQAHFKKRKYKKAIQSFTRAARKNSEFGEAYYNLGAARYRLAVKLLGQAIKKHGSAELRKLLQGAVAAGTKVAIVQGLIKLPKEATAPAVTLLKRSFLDKLKARKLFKSGKWVVIKKPAERKRILAQLDRLKKVHATLVADTPGGRSRLLLALARPVAAGVAKAPKKKKKKKK